MKSDKEILQTFCDRKEESGSYMKTQHRRAREAYAMYAGNDAAYTSGDTARDMVVVNKVKSYVDAVSGFMIQNRRQAKYQASVPDRESQQIYSNFLNDYRSYIRRNCNADQVESAQNLSMLIAGYGAIETGLAFGDEGATRDPNGEYIMGNVPYDRIYWDKSAQDKGLLDSHYIWREKLYDRKDALERFKGSDESDYVAEMPNTNYTYFAGGGTYDKISEGEDPQINDVIVNNYQWWEREKYYRINNPAFDLFRVDPQMAQNVVRSMEFVKEQFMARTSKSEQADLFDFDPRSPILVMTPKLHGVLKNLANEAGIPFEAEDNYRRIYYTALLTDKVVFDKFKSLDQQGYSIKFKVADYDQINNNWFGMLDVMKVPLLYSNKVLTELLRIIANNSKGGVIYEKGVTNDPRALEAKWAKPEASVEVNPDTIDKIRPKSTPYVPNGYDQLLPLFDSYIKDVSGIDRTFLGATQSANETAALQRQRVKQVTSVLASYFDSITLYDKEQARMDVTYMREMSEIDPSRTFRVTDAEGAQLVQETDPSMFVDEYDIEIEEAPSSATENEEKAQIMLAFADKQAMLGNNIYDAVVPYLPLSEAEKVTLLERLKPQEMTPEQQQAMLQAQQEERQMIMAKDQAELAKTQAETENKQADTAVKQATVLEKNADTEQTLLETDYVTSTVPSNINDININI